MEENNLPALLDETIVLSSNGNEHNVMKATIELVKGTIARDLSNEELQLCLYHSKRTGLDFLSRQIYAFTKFDKKSQRNVLSIGVTIDGFRLIAERSGKFCGEIGPYFCGEDGIWKEVWLEKKLPSAAKVGVLRTDFKKPLWSVAKLCNYYTGDKVSPMWDKMPEHMLAKVAEALSLRRAFPHELSGYYTQEELDTVKDSFIKGNDKDAVSEEDISWFIETVLPIMQAKYSVKELVPKHFFGVINSFRNGSLSRERIDKTVVANYSPDKSKSNLVNTSIINTN